MAQPLPICYLNGSYLPLREARISPLDRGFLYADGVYEVMPVYGGRPFRLGAHCERLTRSLAELRMQDPLSRPDWREIFATLIARNGAVDQYVYWQVTRGAEYGRNHAPLPELPRTIFAFCAPLPPVADEVRTNGLACITAADTRWARCDVKSVSLLANVLLRQLAVDAAAGETILLRDGDLTEASSSAVHVVIGGELRTPPHSARLLPGTTRGVVEELAERIRLPHRSMRVSEAELRSADEVWLSAVTREVVPVTTLDGRPVGRGKPGPAWQRIYNEFQRYKHELAGQPLVSREALLQFPTDYPLKVVGRSSDTLRATIDAIVTRHVPDLDASRTSERRSANGNFLSISYTIRAVSAEQVTALGRELSACEAVLFVI